MRTTLEEVCLTEAMTEVRVSERSGLDMGGAADGRSDAPMDMVMEMATAVASIAVETAGEDTLEPLERNENRKRRRRSEVPATAWALGDWRSRMERAAQQRARELAQLHRTITKMAHMLETQTALQETQWRGMKTWLEEKEEKRDAYHKDDVLWGKGITDMVKRVVAPTGWDQREGRKANTEGVSLEASIHADLTQTGGPKKPEERQQLQPERKPKSVPMPKPKPNPSSKPILAPALSATLTPAQRHIDAQRAGGTTADTDQTMGDGPTTKPKKAGQPSPSPGNGLEHRRQMPNL